MACYGVSYSFLWANPVVYLDSKGDVLSNLGRNDWKVAALVASVLEVKVGFNLKLVCL